MLFAFAPQPFVDISLGMQKAAKAGLHLAAVGQLFHLEDLPSDPAQFPSGLAGILRNPTDRWSPVWLTYFGVADPAASAARAASLGGKVLLPVSPEVREGTMAVVQDPSGAILVLQKLTT